ncbi:DUF3054 domain-containing protein [Raineyella sp.]|uniref:DUF3054 domain-containing protein n=1 Tax=bioreactor metagenome TaxID=1076179 RepID=A0A645BG79_9ZZZZ|nr:DUF3054 domain-containing protein [Raineyella sp.]MEA5153515.1 DUF3054 domain-containing protein [Raineyella sp.]
MRTPYVLLLDLVCVVVFAALGRGAHGEAVGLGSVAATAWPFLLGCLAGWGVLRLWRDGTRPLNGLWLMLVTVVIGHTVRVLTGGSTHWTFVLVSVITLSVLLVGWRLVASAVLRRRSVTAR